MGLFSKNKSQRGTKAAVTAAATPTIQPEKKTARNPPERPQVLLIDVDTDSAQILRDANINISEGTFGSLYEVSRSGDVMVVSGEGALGPYAEKDIIVVEIESTSRPLPKNNHPIPDGVEYCWAACEHGRVDTRPLSMDMVCNSFDRIIDNGGVAVVFAYPRRSTSYIRGTKRPFGFGVEPSKRFSLDDWCFLSMLKAVNSSVDHGQDMDVTLDDGPLATLLRRHLRDSSFSCTLTPDRYGPYIPHIDNNEWKTLAKSRFGNTVAAAILPSSGRSGLILVLPAIKRKGEFLRDLLTDALPELMPSLFPTHNGGKWVHRTEYEDPKVVDFRQKIDTVVADANRQIAAYNEAIAVARCDYQFMYDLVRESGPSLVAAVKSALEALGFSSIIDVDSEKLRQGQKNNFAEDLWIQEPGQPLVLVEVKGLTRLAPDAESLQAWKYVAPRMKELGRLDVRALAIINHQRNMPPIERQNENVFRQEVVTNAEEHDFGLMTTWDLFRIVRNAKRCSWPAVLVRQMFYGRGRLSHIPPQYTRVGVVERVLEKAGVVSVRVEVDRISIGSRLGFVREVDIYEQTVESMQVEKMPREYATAGELVGIKTEFRAERIRVGTVVYLVNR